MPSATMKTEEKTATMTVQLTTQEVFDAGRAAQEQGCENLGEFARNAILSAVGNALDGKEGTHEA